MSFLRCYLLKYMNCQFHSTEAEGGYSNSNSTFHRSMKWSARTASCLLKWRYGNWIRMRIQYLWWSEATCFRLGWGYRTLIFHRRIENRIEIGIFFESCKENWIFSENFKAEYTKFDTSVTVYQEIEHFHCQLSSLSLSLSLS